MHVDRSRFLMLAAAIGSSTCVQTGTARDPADGEPGDKEPLVIVVAPAVAPPGDEPAGEEVDEARPSVVSEAADNHASDLARMCRSIKAPGPACESFEDTLETCELYEKAMVPTAAESAAHCVAALSGKKSICSMDVATRCFVKGSQSAPHLVAAKLLCTPVMRQCGAGHHADRDLSQASCEAAVSAVRHDLRGTMVSCIAEGCGVGSCIWDLR